MVIQEIQAAIEAVERDAALGEEMHFASRAEALDDLEFHVLDRIAGLRQAANPPPGLHQLHQRAERVRHSLEAIDAALFQRLRASIRAGHCRGNALRALINAYVGPPAGPHHDTPAIGYDALDDFTNGLLPYQPLPAETTVREPEMVYYQKTPARIIFELAEHAQFQPADVFYDLGAGLGQVPLLVHLLSGVRARGIEIEPAYCAYARRCAAGLRLPQVRFITADARRADYFDGTVFFLYTPFEGRILQAVLDRLRAEAQRRSLRLFTYGPCTLALARTEWLHCPDPTRIHLYKLCEFSSSPA